MSETELELTNQIEVLTAKIHELSDQRFNLNQRLMFMRSKFKIGDVIEWPSGKSVRRGRVDGISEWCCGSPQWKVVPIRKDNSDGEPVYIREYQKPQLAKV